MREQERDLLDKLKRLEMSVANKSSDIESLEKLLAAERERREAENGEIRNMLLQEQKKSQQVVEEAAKYAAQKDRYEEDAREANLELERKNKQLEEMQSRLLDEKTGKVAQQEHVQLRFENRQREMEDDHRDKLTALELKLSKKEKALE